MRQLFLLLDCSYHAFSLAILHKKKNVFVIWMFVQYDCAFYFSIEAKLSSNKIARSILLHEESCCYYPIPSFVLSFNRSDFIGFSIELQLRWSLFVRIVFARARLRWASKFEEKPGLFLHLFQLLASHKPWIELCRRRYKGKQLEDDRDIWNCIPRYLWYTDLCFPEDICCWCNS